METTCGLCGNPVVGVASINEVDYCHPDDPNAIDCYSVAQQFMHGVDEILSRWLA